MVPRCFQQFCSNNSSEISTEKSNRRQRKRRKRKVMTAWSKVKKPVWLNEVEAWKLSYLLYGCFLHEFLHEHGWRIWEWKQRINGSKQREKVSDVKMFFVITENRECLSNEHTAVCFVYLFILLSLSYRILDQTKTLVSRRRWIKYGTTK